MIGQRVHESRDKGELMAYRKASWRQPTAPGSATGSWVAPGVVLLHGGVNASQHLIRLGSALAGTFTVYVPNRPGRG
jgi:hypothetical protein